MVLRQRVEKKEAEIVKDTGKILAGNYQNGCKKKVSAHGNCRESV